jgi:hypothetical protein
MTDDVNAGGAGAGGTGDANFDAGASAGGPAGEPASGPISGTPSFSRPLLPRIKRSSVVAFVNETLDAVDLLADKLAGAVGLHGRPSAGPPAPPEPPPPPPPAAPPPPL